MLCAYGVSVAGPRHLEKGIPCQDAHAFWVSDDGTMAIAAVADGLGSEFFSDEGSDVASRAVVTYLRDHFVPHGGEDDPFDVLRSSFAAAWEAVCSLAGERGQSIDEFDTTLCVAVLSRGTLWWGNSGDSGLVTCHIDGTYELATSMQRTEDGSVYPLCYDDRWEFGCLGNVATLLLCTDGVLEGMIAPPVLAVQTDSPIDREKASQFLHPQADFSACLAGVEESLRAYLEEYPREWVDDDKTVVVVFDDEALPGRQGDQYYAPPDWHAVYERVNSALYGTPSTNDAEDVSSSSEESLDGGPSAGGEPIDLAGVAGELLGVGMEMGRAIRHSMACLSRELGEKGPHSTRRGSVARIGPVSYDTGECGGGEWSASESCEGKDMA